MATRQGFLNDLFAIGRKHPWRVAALPRELKSMSWREFERLIGAAFRQRGFTVTGFGGNGPDGGVDLGLAKDGERFLVQCKHWRKQQVGVTAVHELKEAIAALGAHGGFVLTGGHFTREARDFAETCRIELIGGPSLEALVGAGGPGEPR